MGSQCFQKNLSSENSVKESRGYSYTTRKMHISTKSKVGQVNLPNLSSQKHAWNAKNSSAASWIQVHIHIDKHPVPSLWRRSRPPAHIVSCRERELRFLCGAQASRAPQQPPGWRSRSPVARGWLSPSHPHLAPVLGLSKDGSDRSQPAQLSF